MKQCLSLSKDEANPDIIKAKNALAAISLNRQEISQAMTYTDEVLKASPKNVEAQFTKGSDPSAPRGRHPGRAGVSGRDHRKTRSLSRPT